MVGARAMAGVRVGIRVRVRARARARVRVRTRAFCCDLPTSLNSRPSVTAPDSNTCLKFEKCSLPKVNDD